MPATAGRVRMPANNRMQTSASLNTHSIWQNAIGYDPYAAEDSKGGTSVSDDTANNAYQNMKGLLALARMSNGKQHDDRGGWKGSSSLRGGWAGGKDLGEIKADEDPNAMPSSTDSDSDGEEDASSDSLAGRHKQARERIPEAANKKRKRSEKDKKEKKHKKEKDKEEQERLQGKGPSMEAIYGKGMGLEGKGMPPEMMPAMLTQGVNGKGPSMEAMYGKGMGLEGKGMPPEMMPTMMTKGVDGKGPSMEAIYGKGMGSEGKGMPPEMMPAMMTKGVDGKGPSMEAMYGKGMGIMTNVVILS